MKNPSLIQFLLLSAAAIGMSSDAGFAATCVDEQKIGTFTWFR